MEHVLSGKVIIITGASTGIGAASARALVKLGCKVTVAARSADKLRALAAELGASALDVPADMTQPADIQRMVQKTIERFGRVDVMFANAGVYIPGKITEGDPNAWANLLNVNVEAVLRCIHAVLPHMTAQKSGDILISSSISGHADLQWEPVYSASKHAIQGLTHTLRRQLAPHGLRVGSIAPGVVANELWGITDPAEIERRVQAHSALRSEDVAEAVIFMLSQPPHVTIRDLVILPQNQDI